MVVIIDYGMGNIGSVVNMLQKIGADVIVSSKPSEIKEADQLILPGVGSFDAGIKNLMKLELLYVLHDMVLNRGIPILGICLGMQIMTNKSEEGVLAGLGWIDADTVKFKFTGDENYKIPHMGWNEIKVIKKNNLLFDGIEKDARFYFVHSYYVKCNNENDIIARCEYGIDFVAAISNNRNIYGVQFHPEKSHKFGMALLKNFIELCKKE